MRKAPSHPCEGAALEVKARMSPSVEGAWRTPRREVRYGRTTVARLVAESKPLTDPAVSSFSRAVPAHGLRQQTLVAQRFTLIQAADEHASSAVREVAPAEPDPDVAGRLPGAAEERQVPAPAPPLA